jgi:hypothetical protein
MCTTGSRSAREDRRKLPSGRSPPMMTKTSTSRAVMASAGDRFEVGSTGSTTTQSDSEGVLGRSPAAQTRWLQERSLPSDSRAVGCSATTSTESILAATIVSPESAICRCMASAYGRPLITPGRFSMSGISGSLPPIVLGSTSSTSIFKDRAINAAASPPGPPPPTRMSVIAPQGYTGESTRLSVVLKDSATGRRGGSRPRRRTGRGR